MFPCPVPPLRGSFPVNSLDRFNTHLFPAKIVSRNKPRDPLLKKILMIGLGDNLQEAFLIS